MGKTSLLQELGRQLNQEGWLVLFVDVEAATCPEDAVADIAQAAYEHLPRLSRLKDGMKHWFDESVDELNVHNFRLKLRANLDSASWKRHGDRLLQDCANSGNPVLLIIDELPIFLTRMLNEDKNKLRVEEFLSWLRRTVQTLGEDSPLIFLSGSIGLEPLVKRLGISDRINYLDAFRLGPWDRKTSTACIDELADSYGLAIEAGVADAIYELLGVGIPHHVQSFFARIRDHSIQHELDVVSVNDVENVYRSSLLGASGQNDLAHYESRLNEALDEDGYLIAMEVLAEAAVEGSFTLSAQESLTQQYRDSIDQLRHRIPSVLDVLVHDGYLESRVDGYCFASNLLKDWWAARFRGHHVALTKRAVRHKSS